MAEQIHTHVTTLCTDECTPERHAAGGDWAPGLGPPADWFGKARWLLKKAIDAEDKAVVEASRILAAGYGVRFISTIRNGLHVDVRVERLDYTGKERVR